MMRQQLKISVIGLSLSSSWGNGHATTYRALLRGLAARGHQVHFLERDVPWYRDHRDLASPDFCTFALYDSVEDLVETHGRTLRESNLIIVGSFVPDGVAVIDWVTEHCRGILAFYDIDTPVTLEHLYRADCEYLERRQIPWFDLYLSFTGGPALRRLESEYGAIAARPLYCSFDPDRYYPEPTPTRWDLGYLGTFSEDRQAGLERLLLEPARRWPEGAFAVAGPQYPDSLQWPENVERIDHVAPEDHRKFYCSQRFTLNVTRQPMIRIGYSPSVRLFEAAACGVPIISDRWRGLEDILEPGSEILICDSAQEVYEAIRAISEPERADIGNRARRRVLNEHTAMHRAEQLEGYFLEAFLLGRIRPRAAATVNREERAGAPAQS